MTSRVCAAVVRASSRVSRSKRCNAASTSTSPNAFFTSFTALLSEHSYIVEDTLTRSLLCDLFRHQTKSRNQVRHYFNDDLSHCTRCRDHGVDIEAVDEVFN